MRIYIAGPYSKGDVAMNVRDAVYAANYVAHTLGHVAFVPHLTHFWHMLIPGEYEFWLDQDREWLKVCDAVLRLPGESSGADQEVALAGELGLPVYRAVMEIPKCDEVR